MRANVYEFVNSGSKHSLLLLQNSTSSTSTKQRHLLRCMLCLLLISTYVHFNELHKVFHAWGGALPSYLRVKLCTAMFIYSRVCIMWNTYVEARRRICVLNPYLSPCYCSIGCCASIIHKLFCIIFTKVLLPVLNIDRDKKVQVMFDSRLKWK